MDKKRGSERPEAGRSQGRRLRSAPTKRENFFKELKREEKSKLKRQKQKKKKSLERGERSAETEKEEKNESTRRNMWSLKIVQK